MADDTPRPAGRRTRRSLGWNDADLDAISQVGPEDADAAVVSWDRFAPPEARRLLEAVEEDDDAES